jgi:hypothetical protein
MGLALLPGAVLGFCVGSPTLVFFGFGLLVWAAALAVLFSGHFLAGRAHRRALREERW